MAMLLKWQAMEVRWAQTAAEPLAGLPDPFIELSEAAMGEAAALCEAAGLLPAFRSSVPVLEFSDSGRPRVVAA